MIKIYFIKKYKPLEMKYLSFRYVEGLLEALNILQEPMVGDAARKQQSLSLSFGDILLKACITRSSQKGLSKYFSLFI